LETFAPETTPSSITNPLVILRDTLIAPFIERCAESLLKTQADVIGFSCTFNQVLPSLSVARRIKEARSNILILFGGACLHGKMGEAYARAFQEYIDHVFTGEADRSFVEFLMTLKAGEDLSQISGVTDHGVLHKKAELVFQLDDLPTPNYDDYFGERDELLGSGKKVAEFTNLPYESSRGCWWGQKSHCTFCGLNNEGMKYRTKSSRRVTAELMELSEKHKCTAFMAADNILDHHAYGDLLQKVGDLPLDLNLFYEIKSNVKRDEVAALAKAGVRWVQPGIESFSGRVLRLMRKGVSPLQNVQLLKWLQEYGITPSYNILVGFPGETDTDYKNALAIIERIFHLPPPSGKATLVQVHRFSPFHTSAAELGITGLKAAEYYKHLIPPQTMAAEEFAYFFERELANEAPVLRHLEDLNRVILKWRASALRLSAKLGAGYIEIQRRNDVETVIHRLDRRYSCLLILADHQTSLSELGNQVRQLLSNEIIELQPWVQKLVEDGLLLVDGDRVLSVVPYDRPHTGQELDRWLAYWMIARPKVAIDQEFEWGRTGPSFS
jgi:ribosomal peptide maturation radical SAM protein 1